MRGQTECNRVAVLTADAGIPDLESLTVASSEQHFGPHDRSAARLLTNIISRRLSGSIGWSRPYIVTALEGHTRLYFSYRTVPVLISSEQVRHVSRAEAEMASQEDVLHEFVDERPGPQHGGDEPNFPGRVYGMNLVHRERNLRRPIRLHRG